MIRAILTSGSMRSLRHKPDRSCATKPGHISCHRHGALLRIDLELEPPFDEAGQAGHDPAAGLFAANVDVASSSGGESHPSALPEPDVRLSPHPAPTLQPLAARPVAKERTGRDRGGRCAPASASPHAPGVGTVCTSAAPIS